MGNDEPRDALTAKLKRGRRGSLLESLSSILEKTSRRPRVIGVAMCSDRIGHFVVRRARQAGACHHH